MPVVVKSLPRLVKLTKERESKITTLLERAEKHYTVLPSSMEMAFSLDFGDTDQPTPQSHRRLFAYGFLNARDWDVDKAFEMLKQVIQFRQDNMLDSRALFPTPFSVRGMDTEEVSQLMSLEPRSKGRIDEIFNAINPYLQLGMHYRDKLGQPVLYALLGRCDDAKLLQAIDEVAHIGETPVDVLVKYALHAFCVEDVMKEYSNHLQETGQIAAEGGDASDGLVRAMSIVVDMNGFSLSMLSKAIINLFNETMKVIFANYPDCVHRILVVNCPSSIMIAYNLVKIAFDDNTADKIGFYNPEETTEALLQIIDKKLLPKFLGGLCSCKGNCIANYDPSHPKKVIRSGDSSSSVIKTENIHVDAGEVYVKKLELTAGKRVVYDYVMSSDSVSFHLFFIPSSKVSGTAWKKMTPETAKPYEVRRGKDLKESDTYTASEKGVLVLLWDNRKSWVMGDDIQMRVYVSEKQEK